jgi:hypothetical protein
MKKLRALAWLVAAGLFVMALALPSTTMATKGTPHKVTICHATASVTNPYVRITVDQAAVDGVSSRGPADHRAMHTGDVWNPSMAKGSNWGDIIPPFYADGKTLTGLSPLNWSAAGQAIFYNDCKPAAQTTTTTSTQTTSQATTQTTQTTSRATTSTAVSTTATGSVEGETGTATSTTATGSVEGQTGTAQATPPATDAMDAGSQSPAGSWSLLLLACAIAIVATLVLTPLAKSRRIK